MSSEVQAPPANWYPDPTGRHERRYWNGTAWTGHVHSASGQSVDPMDNSSPVASADTPEPGAQTRREIREREPERAEHVDNAAANAAPTDHPKSKQRKVPFFGAKKHAQDLQTENDRLEALIARYGLLEVSELDDAKLALLGEIARAETDLETARVSTAALAHEADRIQATIVDLRDVVLLQEYGLYDFENPAESSVALATELESLRTDIKRSVRNGQATSATSNFTFNNSVAKGSKFVKDMSTLLLRAYNAEAENCVKTVRAGNLDAARKRLSTVVAQVERQGKMIDLRITSDYHRMRLQELELASRHLQTLQIEKELERARREELREQRKAEQELAREKERLEKERNHYQNALAALEAKGDLEGAERLREKLEDVQKAIDNVDYRAANIRAGYVYVISNIGAFGGDVVKIGLTRRLDPMDRVNELGDASVPFRFDVHALFFADDAVSIEAMLHQHFAERRMNKVNLRREYFRATPAEVLEALKEHQVEVLEYTIEPAAAEYRSSVAPVG